MFLLVLPEHWLHSEDLGGVRRQNFGVLQNEPRKLQDDAHCDGSYQILSRQTQVLPHSLRVGRILGLHYK